MRNKSIQGLRALFCYIVSFWILKSVNGSERKWKIVYVLVGVLLLFKVIMAIYHPVDNIGYYYCYLFPVAGVADFLLGMIIGHNKSKVKMRVNARTTLQVAALIFMIITVLLKFYVYKNYCRAFFTIPATVLTIIAFSQETKFSSAVLGNRLMVFIGDLSFEFTLYIRFACHSLRKRALRG